MPEIADIAIDPTIPSLKFRCDLKRCHGACCTLPGGRGAPLLDSEIDELQRVSAQVKGSLSPRHQEVLTSMGAFEGSPGNYYTTCDNGGACVFVIFDQGTARCALEAAYLQGSTDWRKPLSCHLFPLRIDRNGQERVRFEYLAECEPAYDHGAETRTFLSDFVREALERAYSTDWYRKFADLCYRQRLDGEQTGEHD